MAQVFISYSRRDMRFVEKLAKDLEGKGYDVWFDLTDIEGGERWAQEIQKGIQGSDYFIIAVSPHSIQSEWVEKEFIYASSRKLPIIPVLLETCDLPIWLMNIQYIEMLHRRTYEEGFQKVLNILDGKEPPEVEETKPERNPKLLWAGIGGGVILLALILWAIFGSKPATPSDVITETPTASATESVPTKTQTSTPEPEVTETNTPEEPSPTPTNIGDPTATPLPAEFTDESGAEMVLIPTGKFWMGSDDGEQDARPVHLVDLPDFYMDKFEVTNAQYLECFTEGVCTKPSDTTYFLDFTKKYANYPVAYITWQDAVTFCEWRDARLPTEAEWEKAARGGSAFDYPWGNQWNNKYANANGGNDGYVSASPVTAFESHLSPYGLYNMAGNVWEWTSSWYDLYPDGVASASPYFGEVQRVARGGSWDDGKDNLLTYKRYNLNPVTQNGQIGFRCAESVPTE